MAQGKKKPTPSLAELKVLKDVGEQLTRIGQSPAFIELRQRLNKLEGKLPHIKPSPTFDALGERLRDLAERNPLQVPEPTPPKPASRRRNRKSVKLDLAREIVADLNLNATDGLLLKEKTDRCNAEIAERNKERAACNLPKLPELKSDVVAKALGLRTPKKRSR